MNYEGGINSNPDRPRITKDSQQQIWSPKIVAGGTPYSYIYPALEGGMGGLQALIASIIFKQLHLGLYTRCIQLWFQTQPVTYIQYSAFIYIFSLTCVLLYSELYIVVIQLKMYEKLRIS